MFSEVFVSHSVHMGRGSVSGGAFCQEGGLCQ